MKKRIFSRLMAMVMALSLLSTTALTVDLNQAFVDDESNWSEEYGRKYITLTDSEYTVTEDITTDRTLKFSHPDGNGYGLPQFETTPDLKGHTIDHGGTDGSVIQVANGTTLTIKDTSAKESGKITGGNGSFGGGVELVGSGASLILEGGNITENKADKGGGIGSGGGADFIMSGGSITDNEANENSGAVYLVCGGTFTMTGGIITRNVAAGPDQDSKVIVDGVRACIGSISGDAVVCGNGADGKGINATYDYYCKDVETHHHYLPATCTQPETCQGCGDTQGEPLGHTPSTPVRENEVSAQPGFPGSYDEVVYCTVCGEELSRSTHTIPALPMPIDFGDGTGTGAGTDTTITDEATPLAGILTLADLLNALYEHEEIEDSVLPEDFQWADHVYAQAIYWGLEKALVVDTEDDPLDPDEVLTVGLLREVLVNFAGYKGIDLTVTLDGRDEDLVLDLGERLGAFYKELEEALTGKAA